MQPEPITFLLVEDNEHDVLAFKKAWQHDANPHPLQVVHDGEECLAYLTRKGPFSDPQVAPMPGVILMNNRLPGMTGFHVLKIIRHHEDFNHIPVVLLSATESEYGLLKGYELGANAFIIKPFGIERLAEALGTIRSFWELAEIPRKPI